MRRCGSPSTSSWEDLEDTPEVGKTLKGWRSQLLCPTTRSTRRGGGWPCPVSNKKRQPTCSGTHCPHYRPKSSLRPSLAQGRNRLTIIHERDPSAIIFYGFQYTLRNTPRHTHKSTIWGSSRRITSISMRTAPFSLHRSAPDLAQKKLEPDRYYSEISYCRQEAMKKRLW